MLWITLNILVKVSIALVFNRGEEIMHESRELNNFRNIIRKCDDHESKIAYDNLSPSAKKMIDSIHLWGVDKRINYINQDKMKGVKQKNAHESTKLYSF